MLLQQSLSSRFGPLQQNTSRLKRLAKDRQVFNAAFKSNPTDIVDQVLTELTHVKSQAIPLNSSELWSSSKQGCSDHCQGT